MKTKSNKEERLGKGLKIDSQTMSPRQTPSCSPVDKFLENRLSMVFQNSCFRKTKDKQPKIMFHITDGLKAKKKKKETCHDVLFPELSLSV